MHPETGALWSTEHGRQGGDEVNVILPGKNYGWPVVSYGRDYGGARTSPTVWQDGFEQPLVVWVPSIAITGIAFYTGDKFPAWKGNVFVGGLAERPHLEDRPARADRVQQPRRRDSQGIAADGVEEAGPRCAAGA